MKKRRIVAAVAAIRVLARRGRVGWSRVAPASAGRSRRRRVQRGRVDVTVHATGDLRAIARHAAVRPADGRPVDDRQLAGRAPR